MAILLLIRLLLSTSSILLTSYSNYYFFNIMFKQYTAIIFLVTSSYVRNTNLHHLNILETGNYLTKSKPSSYFIKLHVKL